ncbi:DUF4244 domain-containing protein [Rothia terrae]|uniref:DUF4244 domain-containing protein n=1 Tax=Rothia terrae TaxID=396015 RepID=UPI002881B2AF|nr:DUF4244 domain-containing protein [Rothia terrae]MDT0189940.1 DUF4244 domain-containing protein [Rothia terrae]
MGHFQNLEPISAQRSVHDSELVLEGDVVEHNALVHDPEAGATTAEYGIVMLAAVGFAGLLVMILKSDEVRELLMGIVRNALSTGM